MLVISPFRLDSRPRLKRRTLAAMALTVVIADDHHHVLPEIHLVRMVRTDPRRSRRFYCSVRYVMSSGRPRSTPIDALPVCLQAIRRRRLPFDGVHVVHVDAHPDLSFPRSADAAIVFRPEALYDMLDESVSGTKGATPLMQRWG